MANKEWTPSVGNLEEWSVHAQLSFTPQAGNVVLTASEGPSRDSGYSSERLVNSRGLLGARATCCVTVGGHHTVTLTCSEIPETTGHPTTIAPPQTVHFCHHPPPEKPHRHYHPPPSPPPSSNVPNVQPSPPETTVHPSPVNSLQEAILIPVLKDAASQTSTTSVPQVVQEEPPKKRKARPYKTSNSRTSGGSIANKSSTSGSDGKKNPRTVHIDVYCTGSDSESSSSANDDTNTNSTPQTVFESNKVKVMHSRAHSDSLPHALQRQKRRVLSNSKLDILPKELSGSTISTAYPSPRSSLVSNTTGGFSLTSDSLLSSKMSSNNNSSAATSWKDTDLESTQTSLFKSDSFDYENSFDKLRIKEKERIWSLNRPDERRVLQKRPIIECRPKSSDSSDDDDEEEGLAWSFGRYEEFYKRRNLRREDTVRHQTEAVNINGQIPVPLRKSGSLSDSEASNVKKCKHDVPSSNRPSTSYPFQHWAKATKFGSLVTCLKKPGHHVGPSKNPDCSCDTCKYFFEHVSYYRNRTRSLSESPYV